MDEDTRSDEEILALATTKPDVFAILVKRYQDKFLGRARRILGDPATAEDVVQDTFVKIYLAAGKFRHQAGASFRSWAYRILLNTSFTAYQKLKRQPVALSALDPDLFDYLPDHYAPQEAAERRWEMGRLLLFISRLPNLLRRTATLRLVDGHSSREVAMLEGVSPQVVRTRLSRAKKRLQQMRLETGY